MAKYKISIIEDDENLIDIMSTILSENGHDVSKFLNAENFLVKFKTSIPDIILTDKNLPGKSGIELVKEVRKINKKIPIFVITGRGSNETNVEAYKIGADDFIKKPFEYDVLEAKIQRAIEKVEFKAPNNLIFHEDKQEIQKGQKRSSLTPSEILIFKELLNKKGELVIRDHLKSKYLGISLNVHMSSLRKKLSKLNVKIKNVKGKGYYLKSE